MADAILTRQITEQVTRLRQRQTAPLILELDLTDGIGEGPVSDPLSAILSRRKARMQDIVYGLRRAGRDAESQVCESTATMSSPSMPRRSGRRSAHGKAQGRR